MRKYKLKYIFEGEVSVVEIEAKNRREAIERCSAIGLVPKGKNRTRRRCRPDPD